MIYAAVVLTFSTWSSLRPQSETSSEVRFAFLQTSSHLPNGDCTPSLHNEHMPHAANVMGWC